MGLLSKIFSNTRKPEGFWGRMMVVGMEIIAILAHTNQIRSMKRIMTFFLAMAALVSCGQATQQTAMKEIKATEIKENPVELFDQKWALVTAGVPGDVNTMTISWGSLGELWNKPVVTVYVSSSRYTHEFMEKNDHFTVAFFPPQCRGALQYLGSHSGRDGDKIKESGLTLEWLESGLPSFEEADMIIEARKIYGAPFNTEGFGDVPSQTYSSGRMGVHSEYVGEIEHIWVRGRDGE